MTKHSLLKKFLDYLLAVFIKNGYPENTVWRVLYQESQEKALTTIDLDKSLYVPYHPRAKRLYKIIREQFGYNCIFKKNPNSWRYIILLKKGRQIPKEYRKNIVYSIPCADCNKKYVEQTTKPLKI